VQTECVGEPTDTDLGNRVLDEHLRVVSRVYGPETWDVYDLLDRSLAPRGPETMLSLATEHLTPASVVLDVGCRDASHLVELVSVTGATGVGIDPVSRLVQQARDAVVAVDLAERIQIVEGVIQNIPYPDASFDLVWCRDVIELVEDLEAGIAEIARVLRPDGRLIVFTVLASDLLEPRETAMLLGQNLAAVPENLVKENVEAAFRNAGLVVVVEDEIGTDWREYAEERTQPVSRDLLRLARLRRQRERIIEQVGEEIYGHIESNLQWSVYQFLGKLLPTVYVLSKPV
jgi:ubiquinone/menaquinone biosynthesis C-methylase UbiE